LIIPNRFAETNISRNPTSRREIGSVLPVFADFPHNDADFSVRSTQVDKGRHVPAPGRHLPPPMSTFPWPKWTSRRPIGFVPSFFSDGVR